MKAVLSIDPGEMSGLAVVTAEAAPKLLKCICAMPHKERAPFVDGFIGNFLEEELSVAVIEDQYLGVNPDSMKKLARNSGRWQEACIANGLEVRFVMPSVWQSSELGRGKREQLKKMAVEKCRGLWKVDLESDAADAALLGRYVALKMFYGRWK